MLFLLSLIIAIGAIVVWVNARKKVHNENNPIFKTTASAAGIVALVFALIALTQCFTQIPAGHVGVVDFFGVVSDKPLTAGIQPVNPLANVVKFSIQTKEHKETMQVLSREGLSIGLEISAIYRLNPDSAAQVYKTILGGDYEDIVLVPQFRAISRAITASFQASALYSTEREQLAIGIQNELGATVIKRGIIIEATPLRNVGLPPQLTEAIETKQRADQESQRMQFVLTKEKQEADRKRIEAQGISDFQSIVARGISDQLLRWKGSKLLKRSLNRRTPRSLSLVPEKTACH